MSRMGFHPSQVKLKIHFLTKAEERVLYWVGFGMSYKEVADQIGITKRTVEKHVENMSCKLGVFTQPKIAIIGFYYRQLSSISKV